MNTASSGMFGSTQRPTRPFWASLLGSGVAAIYAFGHLGWYVTTPLGRVPVLDERENIALAHAIAGGTLASEPFYRAPGYALLLAGLQALGVPAAQLFSAALLLGVALHAVNAGLVATIARTWFEGRTAVVAGLLYALNPVLIHFAIQATDATPALTCFLLGLAFVAGELAAAPTAAARPSRWIGASLAWAAAVAMRPNYLLVWLVLPLLALLRAGRATASRGRLCASLAAAALAGAAVFVALGTWQWRLSGQFGFLPTQGAYNLWAANAPGAHGRYFVQHVALPAGAGTVNPTRFESLVLYTRETGRPASDPAAVDRFWRSRFVAHVLHHPLTWLRQLGGKAYALLDTWEQYNNETPAFHLARSPWLRWNPLSWGLLFTFAVAGAFRLRRTAPPLALPLAGIVVALAASALLFYVSARFRLPLVPLVTLLAAGALAAPTFWRTEPRATRTLIAAAVAGTAVVTFSNFAGVQDRTTFVQDHALLARAAATVGDDALAWSEAQAALALRPDHPDALQLAVTSYFNLLLDGQAPRADEAGWDAAAERLLAQGTNDPAVLAVAGVAQWRAGQSAEALGLWRELGDAPSALAARLLVSDPTVSPQALEPLGADAWSEPLVRLAGALASVPDPTGRLAPANARAVVRQLFGPRVTPTAATDRDRFPENRSHP